MSVEIEEIYQKVSQLEHVLLRPDTYVGSVEYIEKTPMWVYDAEQDKLTTREISYVPGLYKIFDEILVNAADNKQRDPSMNIIKVTIDKAKNEISVFNNGKGIPVVMHKVEKMYVPELIFGTLLTSSNYNDSERKVTGGRNGYGAKLCNIFSTKFTVETQSDGKYFKQTWKDNMKKDGDALIKDKKSGEDFTKITFQPDLQRFKMEELDDDIIALMSRRAYDVAGSVNGIKVFLNGKQLPCKDFKTYVQQYVKDYEVDGEPVKVIFDYPHPRWQIALAVSDRGFQQVSFANSIATTKGGRHVDYVVEQITKELVEVVKKKSGKGSVNIKPFQLRNHLWVFVNALIENPTFDSQTKETMTLQAKDFGSKFKLSEKFLKDAASSKCGIVDSVLSWVRFKQQEQQDKNCAKKKSSKIKGIPKLEDANDAGTKNSHLCTLILTEGDSAKSLAVAGLGVIGRDRYGVFPLRGKVLNVRECTHKQLMGNAEINALLKIIGLQYRLKYTSEEEMKTLRYGKIMIMTDQDQDGSHIKGLLINFIHHNWPNLLRNHFIEQFITPIVKVTKGNDTRSFYSLPEYMEWRKNTDNWMSYKIKYYKGLGTSTSKEAKEYFSDMDRHRILFDYSGPQDDEAVDLAFSKKKIEQRKQWLTQWMNVRKERRQNGQMEDYLYERNTRTVTFSDFINKELVLFSNADNERSIPSLMDGLKPGQRKVLFTCFKRADKKEVKVAQLAGAVGEMSAYHHGEQSLAQTIIGLAQDYVGTNNINLLLPNGQFGSRAQGGKDAASPRYIFTQLSPVARTLFPAVDENVLRFLYEESQRIEPEWYCPIIPMVLVNGAEGIGTGWSTSIPNYNPRDVLANIRRLIRGEEQVPLVPWYKNFRGTIEKLDDTRFVCSGEIGTLSETELEITELPVKVWTQKYKESVIEPMTEATSSTDKTTAILDFKEYHTEATVRFVVRMTAEKMQAYERQTLHKVFKLQNVINTTSMVLFDAAGCIRKYNTPEEICKDFFEVRKQKYIERKAWLEGMLQAQSDRLSEQARFIMMKINGQILIENKKKSAIVEQLVKHGFKPDPVKKWKDQQKKKDLEQMGEAAPQEDEIEEDEEADSTDQRAKDYDYLVGMAIWKLSMEDKEKLLADSRAKDEELKTLKTKSWSDLWEEDLNLFLEALEKKEKKDAEDLDAHIKQGVKAAVTDAKTKGAKGRKKQQKNTLSEDVLPSKNAVRVVPTLDVMVAKYKKTAGTRKATTKAADGDKKATRKRKANSDSPGETSLSDSDDEDHLSDEKPPAKKKAPVKKTADTKKKVATKAVTKPAPAARKRKAAPTIESTDDEKHSDVDEEPDVPPPPKRTAPPRRAAATKATKYRVSSDEDDSGEEEESDEDVYTE